MFGLASRGLQALQELVEARVRVAELDATETKQLAKIDALESHEGELVDKIRSLEHQYHFLELKRSVIGAQNARSMRAFIKPKVELANEEPSICDMESQTCPDRPAKRSASEVVTASKVP